MTKTEQDGREPLIYAVMENGSATLVPRDMFTGASQNALLPSSKPVTLKKPRKEKASGENPPSGEKSQTQPDGVALQFIDPTPELARSMRHRTVRRMADALLSAGADLADEDAVNHTLDAAGFPPAVVAVCRADAIMKATKAPKAPGKRAAVLEAAQRGELPAAPDFSAATHARFRKKLAEAVALVEAGNLEGLRAFEINPISSSRKAIARYRDLAVIALEAQAVKKEAA